VKLRHIPEGTGKMISLLEDGEVDIAMTVTDALIVGIASGQRKVNLAGTFVDSPLVWALAAAPGSDPKSFFVDNNNLKRSVRFGVSRLGSGSHTMANYAAAMHAESVEPLPESNFTVANNIEGLVQGIQNSDFDLFLWETFTTKPLFDNSVLRKVLEIPTPWTAFSFACGVGSNAPSTTKCKAIRDLLYPALAEGCMIFKRNEMDQSVRRICGDFGHTEEDAKLWLSRCR
jgi:hypothetical protein